MSRIKPFSKMTMKQKLFVVVIPLIFAIYTPIAEIIAFVNLAQKTDLLTSSLSDTLVVNSNWDSNPITDVKLAVACPSGYSELGKKPANVEVKDLRNMGATGVWPGAKAMCKCGKTTDTSTLSCTINKDPSSPKAPGCKFTKSKDGKNTTVIFQDIVSKCTADMKSAGCTDINNEGEKILTKIPDVGAGTTMTESQQKGYNYKSGKSICIKRNLNVKYSDLATVDTNQTDVNKQCGADTTKCGGICYPIKEGACPLRSFSIQYNVQAKTYNIKLEPLSDITDGEPLVSVAISAGIPCFGKPLTADGFAKPIIQGAPNNEAFESAAGACKRKDTRFDMAGTIAQFDFFNTNEIGNPTGITVTNDKNYEAYNTYDKGAWTLYTQEGIQWSAKCKHTKADLVGVSGKVQTIKGAQEGAYVVQLIFGLFILGLFFPIMAGLQVFEKDQDLMCIPGEGLEEKRNLGICKSVCSFIAILLKLIFIGMASGATQPVYEIYDGTGDCAMDDLTKETVNFITPTVKKIHEGNITAMNLALVSLVFCILNWLYQAYNGCKVDKTLADDETEGVALSEV